MPWTCPACRFSIQHKDEAPKPGVVYRCHICRLDLVSDPTTGKMKLAPLTPTVQPKHPRKDSA